MHAEPDTATVLGNVWAATAGLADPPILVLIGAIGGSVTQQAFDSGHRERHRIPEGVTAVRSGSAL